MRLIFGFVSQGVSTPIFYYYDTVTLSVGFVKTPNLGVLYNTQGPGIYQVYDEVPGQGFSWWRALKSTDTNLNPNNTTPNGTYIHSFCVTSSGKNTGDKITITRASSSTVTTTTTQDLDSCTVEINNISIVDLIVTQNETDYTVKVIAQSYNGIIGYSINDVSYQVSNVFTLLPGSYVFYAKDSLLYKASKSLILEEIQNYSSRWSFVFKDYEGNKHNCYILQEGYNGENEVLEKVGSTPITIRFGKGGSEDIGTPIIGSECILQLESDTDRKFVELTGGSQSKFRLEHYINGELNWSGNIATDVYSEPYTTPPYTVTVSFRDGLAELKDKDFLQDNGDPFTGLVSEKFLIKEALKKTGLKLPIYTYINLLEENADQEEDTITQIHLKAEAFYNNDGEPDSWFEVLESLLEKYFSRIVQAKGRWNIVNINEYVDSYTFNKYTYEGEPIGAEAFNPVVNITPPQIKNNVIQWTNNDQSLEPIPAYSEVKIIHEIEKFESIIRNGDFSEQTESGFKYWNDDFGHLFKETTIINGKQKTTMVLQGGGSNFIESQYIYADQVEIIGGSSGLSFSMNLKFKVIPIGSPTGYKLRLRLKIGPNYFDRSTNAWSQTEAFIDLTSSDFALNKSQEVALEIPALSISAESLDLRIYQASATTNEVQIEKTIIENVSLFITGDVSSIPEEDEYLELNTNGSQSAKFEKKVKWGDVSKYISATSRIKNVLFNTGEITLSDTQVTSGWKRGGTEDGYIPLLTLLADYYMVQYQTTSNRITGKLYSSQVLSMLNSFVDPNAGDNVFIPSSMDIDYKRCEYKVDIVQLKNYADERLEFRLLENGKKRLLEISGFAGIESARLLERGVTIAITKWNETGEGLSDGFITASASGGTAPYTYSINGGDYQSSGSFTGLSAGTYVVRAKDSQGNISSVTIVLYVNVNCGDYAGATLQDLIDAGVTLGQFYNCTLNDLKP